MFPEEWESVYSFSNLLHQLNSPHFQRWKEKKPCNTKKKKQLLYVELICDLEVILVSKKHRITGSERDLYRSSRPILLLRHVP